MFVIIHTRRGTGGVEAVMLADDEETAIARAADYALKLFRGIDWTDEERAYMERELRDDHHYCWSDEFGDSPDRLFIKRAFKVNMVEALK